jgi:hypothetical protein
MSEVSDATQIVLLTARGGYLLGRISIAMAIRTLKLLNTLYHAKWKGKTSFNRLRQTKGEDMLFVNVSTEKESLLKLIEEELTAIVDLGGCVEDVMVNHRAYGKITAPLNVRNRRDVQGFMNKIKTGKSTSLLNVTSGYHFHRISAESVEILDEIEEALKAIGMLAEILPYERELIEI